MGDEMQVSLRDEFVLCRFAGSFAMIGFDEGWDASTHPRINGYLQETEDMERGKEGMTGIPIYGSDAEGRSCKIAICRWDEKQHVHYLEVKQGHRFIRAPLSVIRAALEILPQH